MKTTLQSLSLVLLLITILLVPAWAKENSQAPLYLLKVRVDPSSHKIDCEARIKHPPDTRFYLNKNLEIRRVIANGHSVSFHRDTLPYTVKTAVIIDEEFNGDLLVEYTGTLTRIINGVNMINSDLVELAFYAAWYPLFDDNNLFDFQLDADLPSGFLTTSNGALEHQQDTEGRNLTRWVSFKPGSDIVLLASPHLKKVQENQNGTNVEIFFDKLPAEHIKTKSDRLIKAMEQLSNFYGPPRVKGFLRFVYSPRSGWGYSRIPLFVVSEKYALRQLQKEFGQAKDFHGSAHEMAHFWWSIADTDTPDDWINEGLAEFSAFRLSKKYFGKVFADSLISEYQEHAAQSKTETPIAETKSSSNDRYVNRYEKTTLLLIEARRRFGQEKLDRLLRTLHTRFAGTTNATTEIFLEEVEKQLGLDAKTFFSEALFRKKWSDPQTQP